MYFPEMDSVERYVSLLKRNVTKQVTEQQVKWRKKSREILDHSMLQIQFKNIRSFWWALNLGKFDQFSTYPRMI